jgi:hypothetical protein
MAGPVRVGLNAVIAAVTDEVPRLLTVGDALPFGPLDPGADRTLELGLRRWVREQTGLELGYVEQLYTFGDRNRVEADRLLSIAYLALVREEGPPRKGAAWRDWYRLFPWEDWRAGKPEVIDRLIAPALASWAGSQAAQRDRAEVTFGLAGAPWDGERVLERYELLYEAGLIAEAGAGVQLGEPLTADHRRIAATALGRLRGKLKYRPVVFELLPPTFTLFHLQRVVEALAGVRLHKQNFRRLLERGGLVEGTGELEAGTGGRPAELFHFRREVLRERPAPGVGLPRG